MISANPASTDKLYYIPEKGISGQPSQVSPRRGGQSGIMSSESCPEAAEIAKLTNLVLIIYYNSLIVHDKVHCYDLDLSITTLRITFIPFRCE